MSTDERDIRNDTYYVVNGLDQISPDADSEEADILDVEPSEDHLSETIAYDAETLAGAASVTMPEDAAGTATMAMPADIAGTATMAMPADAAKTVTMAMPADAAKTVTVDMPETVAKTIQIDALEDEEAGEGSSEASEEAETAGDAAGADEGEEAAQEGENPEEKEQDPETEAIKNKIRERKREKAIKARRRRVRFWTGLSVLLISIGAFALSFSSVFTVDSIEVRGNSHFTSEEIINISHAVPGHNIIYNPGSSEIVEYLEQNPYIKSASVSRKLPSTLVITVNERKQACAFKYDTDYLVMDDEGILLRKTRTEPKITMINGIVVSKIRLGDTVGAANQVTFNRTLKLVREMNAGDLYFVRIDMSEFEETRMVRAYVYDNLVVKCEYDLLLDNVSNGRLHKVLEKLFADGVKRGTISFSSNGTASFEPGL